MAAVTWAHCVAEEFIFGKDDVRKATKHFVKQMEEGLRNEGTTMDQIPSYVTSLPDGTDTGLYLAVDLGGTNLRVCSVDLHGDTTFSIKQAKAAIPPEMMVAATFSELFSFIAEKLHLFLETHHADYVHVDSVPKSTTKSEGSHLLLGFTFSFAFEQSALNRGSLMRWTKGFNIPDAIGQDICSVFQAEINKRNLPVIVVALVNDTVGTLLARSYTSPGTTTTLLGAIFGTGTNGAYVEKLQNITKLNPSLGGIMVVNTEWGSFDNELSVLPSTPYDKAVDVESIHSGIQMFEKRISGMYLGEILRHAILAMVSSSKENLPTLKLSEQFAIDASFLSMAASDDSPDFVVLRWQLNHHLGIEADLDTAEAVKILALAIGKRAARLAGVAIAGVVLKSGRLESYQDEPSETTKADRDIESGVAKGNSSQNGLGARFRAIYQNLRKFVGRWSRWLFGSKKGDGKGGEKDVIDIGVDGSLIEFYPGFEDTIRSTLRDIVEIGVDGERRIRIGIAKDGSGVGAALVARMAGIELGRVS